MAGGLMLRATFRVPAIYGAYFAKFLKARLSYRGDFLASIFATALVSVSGVLYVFFLIDGQNVSQLKGWSRNEVLFIYGYSQIATSLFNVLAPNLYQFSDRYVTQGQFDRILLRPLNTLTQIIFESFELETLGSLLVGLAVLIYSKVQLGLTFHWYDYLWLGASTVSGAIILLSVFIILASMSFHFEDRFGIAPPFYNMITFSRYPLPIFNHLVQFVLQWVVPFAFVGFYPATHFFEQKGFELFCYGTPVMAAICLLVANVVWRFGVSRYSSTGN